MRLRSSVVALVVAATVVLGPRLRAAATQASEPTRFPDVIYWPTPPDVVTRMLSLAQVGLGEVVFDLGSSDERIVIAAVRDFGACLGFGVELDPRRVRETIEFAGRARVSDRVFFLNQDLFKADISSATAVRLIWPEVKQRLAAKLRALRPGTRVVSHDYRLAPDWLPDRIERIKGSVGYLFTVKRS